LPNKILQGGGTAGRRNNKSCGHLRSALGDPGWGRGLFPLCCACLVKLLLPVCKMWH